MTKEKYKELSKTLTKSELELAVVAENTKEIEKRLPKNELEAINKVKVKVEIEEPLKKIRLNEDIEKTKPQCVQLLQASIGTQALMHFYHMNLDRPAYAIMADVDKYAAEHGLNRNACRLIVDDISRNYRAKYLRKEMPEIANELYMEKEHPEEVKGYDNLSYDEQKELDEKHEEEEEEQATFSNPFGLHNPFDLWQQ